MNGLERVAANGARVGAGVPAARTLRVGWVGGAVREQDPHRLFSRETR
jgi:hypothetical protein